MNSEAKLSSITKLETSNKIQQKEKANLKLKIQNK